MRTIAYISSLLPLRSETFVYREIRELRRRGWDVVCVSLRRPGESVPGLEDVEHDRLIAYEGHWPELMAEALVHPMRWSRLRGVSVIDALAPGDNTPIQARLKLPAQAAVASALARRLRRLKVRHIHCHFAHAPTSIGMYAAMHLGIPFSFTGHANDLFQRRQLLRRKIARAGFVACISQWHRQLYLDIDPSAEAKCHVVRCGVDVQGWNAPVRRAPRDNARLRVLTVCRLVQKKGVDQLIRALAACGSTGGPPMDLIVAGDGPQREALERLAGDSGVSDRVRFLGAVENDRVRALLNETDLFALPCRDDASGDRDGIPVVLMEAMACGLPVIGGDLPAIRELITHERSGLLVDGNRVEAIASAMSLLAGDAGLRQRLGLAGRRRVEAEFSLEENVSRLEGLFLASIGTGGLSARSVKPITPGTTAPAGRAA